MSAMITIATVLGAAALTPRMLPSSEVKDGGFHFDPVTGTPVHLTSRMGRRRGDVAEDTDGQWDNGVRALEDQM